VWIERKDRALRVGFDKDERSLLRKMGQAVVAAAEKMPTPKHVTRVIAFGLVLPDERAEPLARAFLTLLVRFSWTPRARQRHPDGVCLDLTAIHFGDSGAPGHSRSPPYRRSDTDFVEDRLANEKSKVRARLPSRSRP
jgi:hypothetical protein